MASVRERTNKAGERTWQVLYRHGGKQASKTFAGRKAAHQYASLVDALGADGAAKALSERDETGLTVGELAEQYLTWKARDVTARTMSDYRRDIANWVLPWFGHRAAEYVDEADVQRWVDHMADQLAPKSVADRHMLLHSIYKFGSAKSRRLVTHNPCQETDLPPVRKRRAKGVTVPAWRAILEAASKRNPDAEDLIRFLGTVGWRFSEAIALPVWAVEDRGDTGVWVDMTQVFRVVDNRQVLTPEEAKSYAGFRRVQVLSDDTVAMLRRRVTGKASDDFVFTNARGNHWNQHTFLRDTWPAILTDAGLWKGPRKSPTPHWLRHMAVAVLAAAGLPPQEIQRYIGHEELSTTMGTYGGMLGGVPAEVAVKANEILSGRGALGPLVVGEVVNTPRRLEAP